MYSEFNKSILFKNILFLLKLNSKKVSDLETSLGISAGYLSRLNKEENAKISIELVINIARYFNIDINTLIFFSIGDLSSSEVYLLKILNKLEKDTINNKLEWQTLKKDNLSQLEMDINGNISHPLFSYCDSLSVKESEVIGLPTNICFNSQNYGIHSKLSGDCYFARISNYSNINFIKVSDASNLISKEIIEVWITTNYFDKKFLLDSSENSNLKTQVKKMYSLLEEHFKHPHIEKKYKDFLDIYLNDLSETDINLYTDDSIPY